jgi:hypothetical protein
MASINSHEHASLCGARGRVWPGHGEAPDLPENRAVAAN